MKKFGFIAFGLVVGLATPSQAETVYDCQMKSSKRSWISERIVITHDEANGAVQVHDALVYHTNKGKPAAGKLTRKTDTEKTFTWKTGQMRNSQQQLTPAFDFKATYVGPGNILRVRAKPRKYDNQFTSTGTCTTTTR